jgi:hypothetical protein
MVEVIAAVCKSAVVSSMGAASFGRGYLWEILQAAQLSGSFASGTSELRIRGEFVYCSLQCSTDLL